VKLLTLFDLLIFAYLDMDPIGDCHKRLSRPGEFIALARYSLNLSGSER
jgi:hypothetical protein